MLFEDAKIALIFRKNLSGFSDEVIESLFDYVAQQGDYLGFCYMLNCGLDPQSSNAFWYAVDAGHIQIVEKYIDAGIPYRHMNEAIFAAQSQGHVEIENYLKSL